jgi:hypothetical protein
MIRHIVLIRFRPELSETEINAIFADLHRIKDVLPGVLAITSGRSQSPEKIERGFLSPILRIGMPWLRIRRTPIIAASAPRLWHPRSAGWTVFWFSICRSGSVRHAANHGHRRAARLSGRLVSRCR